MGNKEIIYALALNLEFIKARLIIHSVPSEAKCNLRS